MKIFIIFTRKNGETILFQNAYGNKTDIQANTYITSDKPLYKAGEKVRIS